MTKDVDPTFELRHRASFKSWVSIPIRFSDQDVVGHVNNAAIATYFEHARCDCLLPMIAAAREPGLDIVLARMVIDYVREIRYPGVVDVGSRISRIGTKSFVIHGSAFVGDTCCAIGAATIVFFDKSTRASRLPPPRLRAALQSLA